MPEQDVLEQYQKLIDEGKARPGKDARQKAEAIVAEREASSANDEPAPDKPATSSSASSAAPARELAIGGTGVMSFWVVVAFALVIGAISIVLGHWSSGLFVALMAFLVMGALFPPVAIGIGVVVMLDLLLVHHQELSTQLQSSLGGSPTPATSSSGNWSSSHGVTPGGGLP